MVRWVVLVALVSCDAPTPPPPARVSWLYPVTPTSPLGPQLTRFGRSEAPQVIAPLGIAGEPALALRLPTPWAVPGDGPARAIVYGLEGDRPAIELHEIDGGRVAWRDTVNCRGPVVGVTSQVVVCADVHGTRAVTLDGKPRWHSTATFIVMTDERIVVGAVGEAVIIDAATGDETSRVKLPPGVVASGVQASCGDAGRELFAVGANGRLVRIADGARSAWATPLGAILAIDACEGDSVLVTEVGPAGTALVAIARATGTITGRLDGLRGVWPARDGSARIEVATAAGVSAWSRDLVGPPIATRLPALGELLGKRGDRRLVRATPLTAALLDRDGVRAYLPLAAMGAALGDTAIVAATWIGSIGETVHRVAIPPPWRHPLRLPAGRPGTAVPAELRDLPVVEALDPTAAIAHAAIGMHSVGPIALDPAEPTALYATPLERDADETRGAAVARADLAARSWTWIRRDGCGPGTPIGLAVAREIVVCGARVGTPGTATVRATNLDGTPRWAWTGGNLDAIAAAGDLVAISDADRLIVLDADDGHALATLASDDGAAVRAAVLARGLATWLVTYERGRVVARLPRAEMIAVWSLAVDGVVRELSASRDGVLVALDDGDAFRIDATTARVLALPGLGLAWRATGELVTGDTTGGPIPGTFPPAALRPAIVLRPLVPRDPEAAPIATPIPPPASLGDSWQYTLYELGGGLRARNDYGLAAPVKPAPVRFDGAPLVVTYGVQPRELIVLDPRTGDPLRRVQLPDDAVPDGVFATVVDGAAVTGIVLARPLRVVTF